MLNFKCYIYILHFSIYLMSNLIPYIVFVKFNIKFDIALESAFYIKILNLSNDTKINIVTYCFVSHYVFLRDIHV